MWLGRIVHAGKGPLRLPPHEFAVIKLSRQRDVIAGVLGHTKPEMSRVRGTRRNQVSVHHRTRRPGVPFVDHVAVLIELQRPVKVRAGIYRTLAVIGSLTAPVNGAAPAVLSPELEPAIKRIDSARRKKVTEAPGADHHF